MFTREPKIAPLGITQINWPLADNVMGEELQRKADQRHLDLKTPLGQFKFMELYVPTLVAAGCFRLSISMQIHLDDRTEILPYLGDFNTTWLKGWKEDGALVEAWIVDGSLLDWLRASKNRIS